jgi:hypothetical protein
MSSKQFVSTTNNHNERNDSRLKINKKGKGPLIHLKSKENCVDDLFVLESSDNKEMIKIDSQGELFIKGEKMNENQTEINLGSWKIVSDGDNLLIQKLVENEWITKQHFN